MTDIKAEIDVLPGLDSSARLLEVEDLRVEFRTQAGVAKAINGASLYLEPGETLALLGESGCGKSVTAQAIMGILDSPPGFVTGGSIRYRGVDLLKLPEEQRRRVRANHIAMIFQDALSALNPVFSVGFQLGELFRVHRGMSRSDAKRRAIELLDMVKIPAARQRVNDYPHQFSGGMRQRVMIAMALSCQPKLLIADEPTTALDVTVQAQILDLLQQLQQQMGMSLMLITHDLGVVSQVCQRVIVMYAGEVVEEATRDQLFSQPLHPYTIGLLDSVTSLDGQNERLYSIPGRVPAPGEAIAGCAFQDRCPYVAESCRKTSPSLVETEDGRKVSCLRYSEIVEGVA